jgi:hypothetical protein
LQLFFGTGVFLALDGVPTLLANTGFLMRTVAFGEAFVSVVHRRAEVATDVGEDRVNAGAHGAGFDLHNGLSNLG